MSFDVPDRVHIMPMGYEEERIYEPAEEFHADKVILVRHDKNQDQGRADEHFGNVKDEFEKLGISFATERCDIFDMYECIGLFSDLIRRYEQEEVYLNISTGSKVSAIGGMIAAMITENAVPYYVQASDYSERTPSEIIDYQQLPKYPIDPPQQQQMRILEYIRQRNSAGNLPTKKELIDYSETEELPYLESSETTGKGRYRLLDNNILDPLKDRGYIRVKKEGRDTQIKLTTHGEEALTAFGFLLENDRRVAAA